MAVVAITQQLGSRGEDLGRIIAESLSYRFLSQQDLWEETARRYNVTPEQLLILDERKPHFWERSNNDTRRFQAFYRAALLTWFAQDRVVAVGRAVAHILPAGGCGLRVHVVAPLEERVKQIAGEEKLDLASAQRRALHHDREVRARVQSLSNVDIEDPTVYDLVVNTTGHPLPSLATCVIELTHTIEGRACSEHRETVCDAAIAQQVRAALLAHPKIGEAPVEVSCRTGVVTLSGPGLVSPWNSLVESVARSVPGVASVEIAAEEPPIPQRAG
jgi:cytidylate kinase